MSPDCGKMDKKVSKWSIVRRHFLGKKRPGDKMASVVFSLDDEGEVSIKQFLQTLKDNGIQEDDPRIKNTIEKCKNLDRIDKSSFMECIKDDSATIRKAMGLDFVIPQFSEFTKIIGHLFLTCKANTSGKVATYIPSLAKGDPANWGIAVCTVDGQRFNLGDVDVKFSIQSCSKPFNYALTMTEKGADYVIDYVGREPSGQSFNKIELDPTDKPHNPMINTGAILTAALLRDKHNVDDRVKEMREKYRQIAGGEYVGFDRDTFTGERATAFRNMALAYYMKEKGCFPTGSDLSDDMDMYLSMCAAEINSKTGAVMAATLANGGICPVQSNDQQTRLLSAEAVKHTLSLTSSCGMYDYSGTFAFNVGLPAKSGVSGVVMLVIPNTMGICLFSPNLDKFGNSVRGVQFCEEFVKRCSFHPFENFRHTDLVNPTKPIAHTTDDVKAQLHYAAFYGDLMTIKQLSAKGADMESCDYDSRTALHLAAIEGHLGCVKYLVEDCKVNISPADRWKNIPENEARENGFEEVAKFLQNMKPE